MLPVVQIWNEALTAGLVRWLASFSGKLRHSKSSDPGAFGKKCIEQNPDKWQSLPSGQQDGSMTRQDWHSNKITLRDCTFPGSLGLTRINRLGRVLITTSNTCKPNPWPEFSVPLRKLQNPDWQVLYLPDAGFPLPLSLPPGQLDWFDWCAWCGATTCGQFWRILSQLLFEFDQLWHTMWGSQMNYH